jgi:hypothetical protein
MKILSIILTSSKYKLLLRCIDTVINQYPVNFEYKVVINVNTTNEEYFNKVKKEIPILYKNHNLSIIRTESNGYPGKGHNSCLEIFKRNPVFDYLLMIDGDDMYYPCAFQRFEKFLNKYPDMDLLHMMLNDRVHFSNEDNFNYKNLTLNYKLISAFEDSKNWWMSHKMDTPFVGLIGDNKTPSRIVLCSRNIFETTVPILYSEDMKLYDDYVAFLTFYEAQLRKELNTYSCSDTYIYLYNSLNDDSASYKFKDKEYEQKVWDAEISKFTMVLQDNWNIKKLPFAVINRPENYTTLDKIFYCEKHVISHEIKENIQRYEILNKLDYTKKEDLQKAEFILLYLIKSGIDTEENILKLIQIYFRLKKENSGFLYIFRLERMSPTQSTYEFIFDLFYKHKLYCRCIKYYNILKRYGDITKEIQDNKNIIDSLSYKKETYYAFKKAKINFETDPNKKLLVYYTGFSGPYNGHNYGTKEVYGSEIAAIKICEKLTTEYNVIVLCETETNIVHNKVFYIHYNTWEILRSYFKIDYLIVSRFISCVLDINLLDIENVYFILHDSRVHSQYYSKYIPMFGIPLFYNYYKKFSEIFFVSEWQKNNLELIYNLINEKLDNDNFKILGNGINTINNIDNKFENKDKYKFIYCSNPDRGLSLLCEIVKRLHNIYREVTLDIYFFIIEDPKIQKYIDENDFINFHGKVTNEKINEELAKTSIWIYPNQYSHETFCIACLEAMNNKNAVITRDFSALPELVKDIGILIPTELKDEKLVKFCVKKTIELYNDNEKLEKMQNNLYEKSLNYDWEEVAKRLKRFLL